MDKISTIKRNIFQFIENQGIKKVDFFAKTGLSYANFKGKSLFSELGGDKIAEILTNYPELSPDWLLTGKGSMLRPPELMSEAEMARHDKEVADGKWQVSSAPPQATVVDNEYLLRRFEELVVENAKLKEEINAIKSGKRHVSGVDTYPNIQRAIEAEMMSSFAAERTEKYGKK